MSTNGNGSAGRRRLRLRTPQGYMLYPYQQIFVKGLSRRFVRNAIQRPMMNAPEVAFVLLEKRLLRWIVILGRFNDRNW